MKTFIVLALFVAVAIAAPRKHSSHRKYSPKYALERVKPVPVAPAHPVEPERSQPGQILRFDNDNIGVGPYNYVYETSDGQRREEHGELRNIGTDHETVVVHGSYSWRSNGVTYTVNYVADENGFQPTGTHIHPSI